MRHSVVVVLDGLQKCALSEVSTEVLQRRLGVLSKRLMKVQTMTSIMCEHHNVDGAAHPTRLYKHVVVCEDGLCMLDIPDDDVDDVV